MSYQLFISYAAEDRAYVEALAGRIRDELQIEAWWFEGKQRPGVSYRSEIMERIRAAPAVILILSPHSANSRGVLDEISFALDLTSKPIIPIVIGEEHADNLIKHVRDGEVTFAVRNLDMIDGRVGRDPLPRLRHALATSTTQLIDEPLESGPALPEMIVPTELAGTTRAGYVFEACVAHTNLSLVYRAREVAVGRPVAVKVILPEYANQRAYIRHFEAEARRVARLEHPHIVPLYNYWHDASGAYLVMRWMPGGSLEQVLADGPLPLPTVAHTFAQIANALAYAHRQSVIHRDIKPANILIDSGDNAYLSDFGIAQDPTIARATGYSAGYAPPEQRQGGKATPQTDIYSLARVLLELLAGKGATNTPADRPPSLQELLPDLPVALHAAIGRALDSDPTARHQDVVSFAAEVSAALYTALRAAGASDQEASEAVQPPDLPAAPNPYKALHAFTESDAGNFFGRTALMRELLNRLMESGAAARFLAVVGPSGSGKSSVVQAGLIPALQAGLLPGAEAWEIAVVVPGADPVENLTAALQALADRPLPDLGALLSADEYGLREAIEQVLPPDPAVELLLVIDQFEELWTLQVDPARRAHVLASLLAALYEPGSRLHVVVTLRADFYVHLLNMPSFGALAKERTTFVVVPNEAELEEAIVRPAEGAGARVERALVREILADVEDQPGALPLVQYALHDLFEHRDGALLTLKQYHERGGIKGALARRADEVCAELTATQQELARQLFLRLIAPGDGHEHTRRRVSQAERALLHPPADARASTDTPGAADLQLVLERFGRARLLTFDRDSATHEPTVAVAHEALIRAWPRLQAWLVQAGDDLRLHRRLHEAAREWAFNKRNPDYLAHGGPLAQFEELGRTGRIALNPLERSFLDASLVRQQQEEQADRERQAHELEQARALAEEQRQRADERAAAARRLRAGIVLLIGALVVMLGTLVVALGALLLVGWSRNQLQQAERQARTQQQLAEQAEQDALEARRLAEEQRDFAQQQARITAANRVAAQAMTHLNDKPDLGMLLSLEANDIASTVEISRSLLAGLTAHPQLVTFLREHRAEVAEVAFSADGKRFASGSWDGTIMLWDATTLKPLAPPWQAHDDNVRSLVFSPDGTVLASGSDDRQIIVWDTATRRELRRMRGHEASVSSVAFSPDGTLLVSSSCARYNAQDVCEQGELRVWNTSTGEPRGQPLRGHVDRIWSAAFSPDGTLLASGSCAEKKEDECIRGEVRLWDVATGQVAAAFGDQSDTLYKIAFSPDGRLLASGSRDTTIRLWDVATGQAVGAPLRVHTNSVLSLAFSPDGKRLASGGFDNVVRLWDVATAQPIGTPLVGHTSAVNSLAFSPDGHTLLSGSRDHTMIVWDLSQPPFPRMGRPFATQGLNISSVAFSPDNRLLATASWDNTIVLWDTATDQQVGPPLGGDLGRVNSVAFSPDGTLLISGSDDDKAILWEVVTGARVRDFVGHENDVRSVAFSPDGRLVASGSLDETVRLWNVDTGKLIAILDGHTGSVRSVAFSPDGKTVASASIDHTIIVWDVATQQPLRTLSAHTDAVYSVAFSPNGSFLASGGRDKLVIVWNAATGEELHRFTKHTHSVLSVTFSPDSNILTSTGLDGTILRWDTSTYASIGTPLVDPDGAVWSLAFSPDGQTLAAGNDQGRITRWDAAGRRIRQQLEQVGYVWSVAYSPDGTLLASGGKGNVIILRDTAEGRRLRVLAGHKNWIRSLAFSPDGTLLASASSDDTIILWDVASGKQVGEPLTAHTDNVRSVAFSPDGTLLASGGEDQRVILWDVAKRTPVRAPLTGHEGDVNSVAFRPDGKLLASGSDDRSILLWDVATGEERGKLTGHRDWIYSVAFSPDGRVLASASEDSTVILWDVASRQPIGVPLSDHKRWVYSVAFSPNGTILASGSGDNSLMLWDVATHQPLGRMMVAQRVNTVVFSPDGAALVSAGGIAPIMLWELTISGETRREQICSIVRRNLTWAEWETYLADVQEQYHRTCPDIPLDVDALALLRQAHAYERAGDQQKATAAFALAVEQIAVSDDANQHSLVCLVGSINGFAGAAQACDRAFKLAQSDGKVYERHGVAMALAGRREEAIKDFRIYLTWARAHGESQEAIDLRQSWVDALSNGENPFDEATLDLLVDEAFTAE